jgi:hypothetical protein
MKKLLIAVVILILTFGNAQAYSRWTLKNTAGLALTISFIALAVQGAMLQDKAKPEEQNQRGRRMIAGGMAGVLVMAYVYRF